MSDTWVSAHLFCHGDLDDVVSRVVGPVVREIEAASYFYLRYWEGGPHVRLRILVPEQDSAAVEEVVRARADAFFADHRSPDRMSAERYRAIREWALRLEPHSAPETELSPNNSVRFVPYRPENDKYGGGNSLAAVERHFVVSSAIALDAVELGMPPGERVLLALCGLVAGWAIAYPDPDELCAWLASGGPLLADAGNPAENPDWLTARKDALRSVVAQTILTAHDMPAERKNPTMRQRWGRSLLNLRGELTGMRRPPAYILDNCGHLLCNRLGLSLTREATVRMAAASAALEAMDGP